MTDTPTLDQRNDTETASNAILLAQALVDDSQWAKLVLDALPDQVYVKDKRCRFKYVNASLAQALGKPARSILGRTDFDFFPAELAQQFYDEEQALMNSGIAVINREAKLTDGSGLSYWVSTNKVSLHDSAGNVIGTAGVNRDITARKGVDQQLHLQATALAAVGNGVCITDTKGKILWVNPAFCRLTGYQVHEVVGQNPRVLKSGQHSVEFYRELWETVLAGRVWHGEIINRRKDGSLWVNDAIITPVRDAYGTIINLVAVQQDITERRRAADELQQINHDLARSQIELLAVHEQLKATQTRLIQTEKLESVGRLAAGIAHEVKNPLAILLMGLSYLEDAPGQADPGTATVLHDMRVAIEHADAIIRELLDFSSPRHLELDGEDLNALIERSLLLVRHELRRRKIAVTRQLAENLPHRHMDRIRVQQVFINLFMNAVHAMPNGGQLTVRTGLDATDAVVAEVCDTGSGIPEADLVKVFEPFYTTKPIGVGTGIGLSVAKSIMTQHGGDLTLANRPEGGVCTRMVFHNGKENDHGDTTGTDRR